MQLPVHTLDRTTSMSVTLLSKADRQIGNLSKAKNRSRANLGMALKTCVTAVAGRGGKCPVVRRY